MPIANCDLLLNSPRRGSSAPSEAHFLHSVASYSKNETNLSWFAREFSDFCAESPISWEPLIPLLSKRGHLVTWALQLASMEDLPKFCGGNESSYLNSAMIIKWVININCVEEYLYMFTFSKQEGFLLSVIKFYSASNETLGNNVSVRYTWLFATM